MRDTYIPLLRVSVCFEHCESLDELVRDDGVGEDGVDLILRVLVDVLREEVETAVELSRRF